jgi:hypothetical protein
MEIIEEPAIQVSSTHLESNLFMEKDKEKHPMGNVIGNNETTFESMNELNLPVVS